MTILDGQLFLLIGRWPLTILLDQSLTGDRGFSTIPSSWQQPLTIPITRPAKINDQQMSYLNNNNQLTDDNWLPLGMDKLSPLIDWWLPTHPAIGQSVISWWPPTVLADNCPCQPTHVKGREGKIFFLYHCQTRKQNRYSRKHFLGKIFCTYKNTDSYRDIPIEFHFLCVYFYWTCGSK